MFFHRGIPIHPSNILEPEFYAIKDWLNPEATSKPEWLSIWFIGRDCVAHPTVIKKLKEANNG